MQCLSNDLFARPVLSGDEHVGVGGPNPRHRLEHRSHRRCRSNKVRSPWSTQNAILRLQPPGSLLAAMQFHLGSQNTQQPRILPRLLDKVSCAAPHRLYRKVDAAPRRHHHHGQLRIYFLYAGNQVQAFLPGGCIPRVVEINQDSVEVLMRQCIEHQRWSSDHLQLIALRFQQQTQRLQNMRLVIGDQKSVGRLLFPCRLRALLHTFCQHLACFRPYSLRGAIPVFADSIEIEFACSVSPTARSSSILAFWYAVIAATSVDSASARSRRAVRV